MKLLLLSITAVSFGGHLVKAIPPCDPFGEFEIADCPNNLESTCKTDQGEDCECRLSKWGIECVCDTVGRVSDDFTCPSKQKANGIGPLDLGCKRRFPTWIDCVYCDCVGVKLAKTMCGMPTLICNLSLAPSNNKFIITACASNGR